MTTTATEPGKAQLSFRNEDFAADIAKLAAETGQPNPLEQNKTVAIETPKADAPAHTEAPASTPAPAAVTPEATANAATAEKAAPQVVTVPDKFKTPDGGIDTAKVLKSSAEADKALSRYLEKEKELKRKINEVKQAENAYLNPAAVPSVPAPSTVSPAQAQVIPFEQQLEQDVQAIGLGKTLAKLFVAAKDSALEEARKELTPLKQGFEQATTRQQIEAIGKADPWVYTEEGVNTLNNILADQPYMWQAADPYKAAYIYHQGLNGVTRAVNGPSNPQVLTPTPQAKAAAPVPPAVAANSTTEPEISLNNREDIEAHLKKLTPAQQEQFFIKAGLPSFKDGAFR